MERLPATIARFQENGLYYDERLADVPGVTVLKRPVDSRSAYWVYTFLARNREHLLTQLRQQGIYASKVHLRNDLYTCFGDSSAVLPGVDHFSAQSISIPCGWWVSDKDREFIASFVQEKAG